MIPGASFGVRRFASSSDAESDKEGVAMSAEEISQESVLAEAEGGVAAEMNEAGELEAISSETEAALVEEGSEAT